MKDQNKFMQSLNLLSLAVGLLHCSLSLSPLSSVKSLLILRKYLAPYSYDAPFRCLLNFQEQFWHLARVVRLYILLRTHSHP